jgi:hypothetical protein
MSAFPWDMIKAESLRSVGRDLGFRHHKREELVRLLKLAEQQGGKWACTQFGAVIWNSNFVSTVVEAALEEDKESRIVAASKRNSAAADIAQSQRLKRSRRSDPGPGMMVTRNKGIRTKSYRTSLVRPKRTSPAKKTNTRAVPQTFDGVLLPGRRQSLGSGSLKRKRKESPEEFEDDEGDDIDAEAEIDPEQDEQAGVTDESEPQVGNGSEKGKHHMHEPLLHFVGIHYEAGSRKRSTFRTRKWKWNACRS